VKVGIPDLGSISQFLASLGGLWSRAEEYLPLLQQVAVALAGLVFTFTMLQLMFDDGTEEDYFRIMARFGIALALLSEYRGLFMELNQASSSLAHLFADPNSFQNFFSQLQSQFTLLNSVITFTSLLTGSLTTLVVLVAAVILVLAYVGLVLAQAIAVILLYVFGPLFLALLPHRRLSVATYNYFKALVQVLLWPAVWSLIFALFTGALLQVIVQPLTNLIPAILLVLLAIILTQIPKLTAYVTSGVLNAAGGALSELVTAGLMYITYRVAETGTSVGLALATGGSATTLPQGVGYVIRSRSSEPATSLQTQFTPTPPPELET
jgi:predicted small integral membrane protein